MLNSRDTQSIAVFNEIDLAPLTAFAYHTQHSQ